MKRPAALLPSCATPPADEVQAFPLHHQTADSRVWIVAGDERARSGLTGIATDARTNSIVAGGTRECLDRIAARIRELDVR